MARVQFSPVPPTKQFRRRRLVARIADLQSADGSSILLAGAMCPVRPMDQDRTLRTFRSQFESGAGYQACGVVAERQRHFTVYEDQVGSTPIHFANSLEQVIAGSNPAVLAKLSRRNSIPGTNRQTPGGGPFNSCQANQVKAPG